MLKFILAATMVFGSSAALAKSKHGKHPKKAAHSKTHKKAAHKKAATPAPAQESVDPVPVPATDPGQ